MGVGTSSMPCAISITSVRNAFLRVPTKTKSGGGDILGILYLEMEY